MYENNELPPGNNYAMFKFDEEFNGDPLKHDLWMSKFLAAVNKA